MIYLLSMMQIDMNMTRANVEEHAKAKGYEPVQIDGIPEGFSFRKPDVNIGGVSHIGQFIAFIPLADWDNDSTVLASTPNDLLNAYNKKNNGK